MYERLLIYRCLFTLGGS
ncbi:Protein CBG25549 [Caenorhabditis briggsae]|uniref:Protein CBG25549 n=1 Tax=Caenorhabditis briggsae TaxID=6238 RepID=B6IF36_CAEBR|nr:Protein CBG25549 [Caenorhabditis briggsae]CAR98516.1 Protein CBG25549 [Caenorhabditis briggsae]